jgi:hypothetical protein
MSLQSMLTGNWFEQLATATFATPATPATPEPDLPEIAPTVATVARVAVANPTDQKAANEIMRLNPKPPEAVDKRTGRFTARLALFTAHGLSQRYADAVAQKLMQRDLIQDERRLCLECNYLSGSTTARRCSKWQALGLLSPAIPGDTVDLLQRCESFDDRLEGMA